jgi:hypothetical protein
MASGCHCWHGTARVTPMSSVCKARTPGKSKQRQVEAYICIYISFQIFSGVSRSSNQCPRIPQLQRTIARKFKSFIDATVV